MDNNDHLTRSVLRRARDSGGVPGGVVAQPVGSAGRRSHWGASASGLAAQDNRVTAGL